MSRIQKLDSQTANMIAAGEVVERPRGVVKELVENAMDAGATRIMISMEEGGLKKIVVEDNGCGMDHTDARACFGRHATSKIHSQNDLWNIHTMGFRGEALPSIAAAAKVTLLTSDGTDGTEVIMAYGDEKAYHDAPAPQGTRITVEDLFYETPARLKHMRSASYEGSLIQTLVQTFALGSPAVAFRLYNENREVFRTSGNGSLQEVVYQVYGRGAAENAIPIDFEDYDYHVTGCLIRPMISRASRYGMHIFLNGRMVHDLKLERAVLDGYQGFLPEGRYPLAVISVQMDPHIIDVNVHPSKWEVRLSKENQLEYLLKDQISQVLEAKMNSVSEKEEAAEKTAPARTVYYTPLQFTEENLRPQSMVRQKEPPAYEQKMKTAEEEKAEDEAQLKKIMPEQPEEEETEEVPFPPAQLIGQYRKDYLLCACEQGLMIIHLYRARQRLAYEKCIREMKENRHHQDLLVPLTMHVGRADVNRVDELNEAVKDTGIVYEPFGSDTLLVRSVPVWLKDMQESEQILQDLCELYLKEDRRVDVQDLAAKEAVKHLPVESRTLREEEMKAYLDALGSCRNAWTDPFGRPITVIVDDRRLLREFA
jgi:DNA mismatch repair protein MutL